MFAKLSSWIWTPWSSLRKVSKLIIKNRPSMQDSGITTNLLGTLLPVKTQVLVPYRFCSELFYLYRICNRFIWFPNSYSQLYFYRSNIYIRDRSWLLHSPVGIVIVVWVHLAENMLWCSKNLPMFGICWCLEDTHSANHSILRLWCWCIFLHLDQFYLCLSQVNLEATFFWIFQHMGFIPVIHTWGILFPFLCSLRICQVRFLRKIFGNDWNWLWVIVWRHSCQQTAQSALFQICTLSSACWSILIAISLAMSCILFSQQPYHLLQFLPRFPVVTKQLVQKMHASACWTILIATTPVAFCLQFSQQIYCFPQFVPQFHIGSKQLGQQIQDNNSSMWKPEKQQTSEHELQVFSFNGANEK